jgi:hypothetical protein
MTDVLQTILADPGLRQWPRYSEPVTNTTEQAPLEPGIDAPESTPEEPDTAPPVGAIDEHQSAVDKIRSVTDPDANRLPPSEDIGGERTGDETPPLTTAEKEDAVARTADPQTPPEPPADSTPADETEPAASPDTTAGPLAFDDIAAKPNPVAARFGAAGQWLKNRDWKNPRTLGAAAATVLAAAAVGYWILGSGESAQAPTAQVASGGNTAPASPAPPATPADAPITASAATARCPAPSSDPMNALRPESAQPWICVQAWSTPGQLLDVTFDKAYVVGAVSIMPGANSEDAGEDQWAKYRTVTQLNWSFNDAASTSCTMDTHNLRKLATLTITPANCYQRGPWQPVVASAVTVTIQKTSEPSNPDTLGRPVSDVGGAGYTAFAVSRLELIGHPAS